MLRIKSFKLLATSLDTNASRLQLVADSMSRQNKGQNPSNLPSLQVNNKMSLEASKIAYQTEVS